MSEERELTPYELHGPRMLARGAGYTSSTATTIDREAAAVTESEQRVTAAVRKCEDAAKATADLNRDAEFARRAAKLALEADRLDKDMRAAAVDRDVYRQVAHAVRALQVG